MNASSAPSRPAAQPASITAGLGLMILAMLLAPLMDVFSKLATNASSPMMITTARFVFQGLCMLPFVLWSGSWRKFSWQLSFYHAIRAAVVALSMICFVATLAVMPVADAVAIFFVEPIILTVLSSIFLKEVIGWRRYTACAVGFIGAMIVIRPSFQEIGAIALLPVVTAFCIAIFAMMTRALSQREEPLGMQFQMALWGVPICAALLFIGHVVEIDFLAPSLPDATTWTWLIGVGVFATLSGLFSVYAYRAAPASVLAPIQYFEIVSATLFGWIVFGDFPDPIKWLGIAIIIGSGLYIIWRERRVASIKPVTNSETTSVAP
jgi:drug/metabolite transporter (DMT)-like permease